MSKLQPVAECRSAFETRNLPDLQVHNKQLSSKSDIINRKTKKSVFKSKYTIRLLCYMFKKSEIDINC